MTQALTLACLAIKRFPDNNARRLRQAVVPVRKVLGDSRAAVAVAMTHLLVNM